MHTVALGAILASLLTSPLVAVDLQVGTPSDAIAVACLGKAEVDAFIGYATARPFMAAAEDAEKLNIGCQAIDPTGLYRNGSMLSGYAIFYAHQRYLISYWLTRGGDMIYLIDPP